MKKIIVFALLFINVSVVFSQEYKFYAISNDSGISKAIYFCGLEKETGAISIIEKYEGTVGGNYFALSPDAKHLLVTSKNSSKNKGGLVQYDIGNDGSLTYIKSQFKQVDDMPCHVSFTPDMKYALSANYGDDEISLYSFSDKSLTAEIDNIIKPDNSKGHFICTDPSGKFVHAVFLGLDKIFNYTIENDKLLENSHQASFSLPDGYGPRHLVFHPESGLYILNETHSSVTACSYNPETGEISETQNISMLPSGFEGNNHAAAIRIHPNGKFLYASNRGHNSIAVFKIESNGHLSIVEHESSGINYPRDFVISSDGKFMIVGNQRGNSFRSYRIDESTGELNYTGNQVAMSKPTAFAFLPVNTATTVNFLLKEINNEVKIAFPNPTRDVLHLASRDGTTIKKVELYNQSGTLVKQITDLQSNTIDVSKVTRGFYLLVVSTNSDPAVQKILLK